METNVGQESAGDVRQEMACGNEGVQYAEGGFPSQRQDTHRSSAGEDAKRQAVTAQNYQHQANCPHTQSMYNTNQNQRQGCHHSCHYQHRCYRPMQNNMNPNAGMLGFGNISINPETGITGNNAMMPNMVNNNNNNRVEPCFHHRGSPMYTPNNCMQSIPENNHVNNELQETCSKQELKSCLKNTNEEPLMQARNTSAEQTVRHAETRQEIQNENTAQTNDSRNENEAHDHGQCQHEHAQEHEDHGNQHEHDPEQSRYVNEEDSAPNDDRYRRYEVRNMREISKCLTGDSAKSLIYFQGPDSDYTKTERETLNHSRNKRFTQQIVHPINTTQSLSSVNLNQQTPQPNQGNRNLRSAQNDSEDVQMIPTKGPRSVTLTGEDVPRQAYRTPVEQPPVAEAAEGDNGTGDANNCETNSCNRSESSFAIGDGQRQNLPTKPTRRVSVREEVKRRNGLE